MASVKQYEAIVFTAELDEYYEIIGVFVACHDLDMKHLKNIFTLKYPEQDINFEFHKFAAWLVEKGHFWHVPTREIWLGDYGKFDLIDQGN